jgi:beta-galactosidase
LLGKNHVLASEQFELPFSTSAKKLDTNLLPAVSTSETVQEISVKGKDFAITIDKATGTISSFIYVGKQMLRQGLLPNFRRAPTDDDIGCRMFEKCKPWWDASDNRQVKSITLDNTNTKAVTVSVNFYFPDPQAEMTVSYTITGNGDVMVSNRLKSSNTLPWIPRLGMNMRINGELNQVDWFGRGPFENYSDRKTAAFAGRYHTTVNEMYTPYVRPQENGYRTDVRWFALSDGATWGIYFEGTPNLGFSALPYTYDNLKGFKHGGKHGNLLTKQDFTDLNIDFQQCGLGGDDSWWSWPMEKYLIPSGNYEWSYRLRPYLIKNEKPEELWETKVE